MSETKFTKRRALWLNGATSEQFVVDTDNPAVVVSRYPSVYDATDIDQANAALDVAAPDLYAALKGLVEKLAIDDEEGLIECAEPMIAARAALAKARGEA